MSKQISLPHDMFATVDDADFDLLSQRKWHVVKPKNPAWPTYVAGWASRKGPVKPTHQDRMARLITGAGPNEKVIFIDGNGLNNTRENLVVVSKTFGNYHGNLSSTNTSGAKGVSFSTKKHIQRRWRAFITINGKMRTIGSYATFDEAVAARKRTEEGMGLRVKDIPIGPENPDQPRIGHSSRPTKDKFHALSEINETEKTAICAQCGPVGIRRNARLGNAWRCVIRAKEIRFNNHKKINHNRDLIRRPHRKHLKDQCERCGFVADHPCQMDVHHRDYDAKNNAPENLETLCANCHRLETQLKRDSLFLTDPNPVSRWVGARGKFGVKKGGESSNTSGTAGVSWINSKKKWRAVIGVNGESIYLGVFRDYEEAVFARKAAEIHYFGSTTPQPA